MAAVPTITIECLRYNPETDSEPRYQSYQVPYSEEISVLQGLQYIKDHLDGSLTFRWSCRMAICGSCGHMVNGVPTLSCQTFLRDYFPNTVRVEPLTHFPIVRDLVIDQSDFLKKLESIKPYVIPRQPKSVGDGPYRQTPEQMDEYYQYAQCINCLLCYAACPQYGLNPNFTGPAAFALLHRYNAEDGVWGCTLVSYCSEVCPKGVDPARAVNQNKINSTKDYFLHFLMPKGGS